MSLMITDFILNGEGHGSMGEYMARMRFDSGLMRPYFDSKGRPTVNILYQGERQPIFVRDLPKMGINSPAINMVVNATTLRKDEWIKIDQQVMEVARQRLRAWSDLERAASLSVPGMSKTILEHEMMNDPGEAIVDMDGMSEGRGDAPQFKLQGIPLPITHSSFHFSERKLSVSRNGGTPLDTTMAAISARRVAESVEKTLIGVQTGMTYGASSGYDQTSQIYGYLTHPTRNTKTDLTTPTGSNGTAVLTDVLEMIEVAQGDNMYGPYMLYHSTDYSQYLDNLFSTTEPSAGTLRNRIREIDEITDVRRLDYLPAASNPFTLILVQMTSDVAQAVVGMPLTTIQWPEMGGLRQNFKVMTIMVPRLRTDYNGQSGIVVGTTS